MPRMPRSLPSDRQADYLAEMREDLDRVRARLVEDLPWVDYSDDVVLTNMTVGAGTIDASYIRTPEGVTVKYRFILGTGSAIGSNVAVSIPFSCQLDRGFELNGSYGQAYNDDDGARYPLMTYRINDDSFGLMTIAGALVSATVPFTWDPGDIWWLTLRYQPVPGE